MALGERRLDLWLSLSKQIKRGVEFVLIDGSQFQHRPQRMSSGRFAQLARRRQLRGGLDHSRHDHGQPQLAQPRRRQQLIKLKLLGHAQHGSYMSVRQRALDPERVLGYNGCIAL